MPTRGSWRYEALVEGLDPAPDFVAELERLGLLSVVARTEDGEPLYASGARDALERALTLVDAGYAPRDIAVIAKRVGLPKTRRSLIRRPPTCVDAETLSDLAQLDAERVARWAADGVLEPEFVTEDGVALYAKAQVEVARLGADLLALGLDDEDVARWRTLDRRMAELTSAARGEGDGARGEQARAAALVEETRGFLRRLRRQLERVRRAERRWQRVLGALEKRLGKLRKHSSVDVPRERRGRRRRARTRTKMRVALGRKKRTAKKSRGG